MWMMSQRNDIQDTFPVLSAVSGSDGYCLNMQPESAFFKRIRHGVAIQAVGIFKNTEIEGE
jgi:hypothetical protein